MKIEQRKWAISSSKIVVHAELAKMGRIPEKRRETEQAERAAAQPAGYALGGAHED
jgi:hypothetical protein